MHPPRKPADDAVALNIFAHVLRALGRDWDVRLTDADRARVRACCGDAARLCLRALATPRNRDLETELLRYKAAIHAELCAVRAGAAHAGAAGRDLPDVFWDGVRATVNGAVAVAFAAL
jgi:hypothetical protein